MIAALSPHVGPHTAKNAVRTFAKRTLNMAPEAMTVEDAVKVLESLQATLAALVGTNAAKDIVETLTVELRS